MSSYLTKNHFLFVLVLLSQLSCKQAFLSEGDIAILAQADSNLIEGREQLEETMYKFLQSQRPIKELVNRDFNVLEAMLDFREQRKLRDSLSHLVQFPSHNLVEVYQEFHTFLNEERLKYGIEDHPDQIENFYNHHHLNSQLALDHLMWLNRLKIMIYPSSPFSWEVGVIKFEDRVILISEPSASGNFTIDRVVFSSDIKDSINTDNLFPWFEFEFRDDTTWIAQVFISRPTGGDTTVYLTEYVDYQHLTFDFEL